MQSRNDNTSGSISGKGEIVVFSLEENKGWIRPDGCKSQRNWVVFELRSLMRSGFVLADARAYEGRRVRYKAFPAGEEHTSPLVFEIRPIYVTGDRVEGSGHIKFFNVSGNFGYIETDEETDGKDIRFDMATLFLSGFYLEDPNEYRGQIVRFEAFRDRCGNLIAASIKPINEEENYE